MVLFGKVWDGIIGGTFDVQRLKGGGGGGGGLFFSAGFC